MKVINAAGWILATILVPLVPILLFCTLYITGWYFKTRHAGSPPVSVILHGQFFGIPPGLWLAVGLAWLLNRRRAPFSELFATRTNSPGRDVLIGIVVGIVLVLMYGWGDVVSFEQMTRLDRLKLVSIPASLSAGFCEEFLCRGFLFWVFAQAGTGKKVQWLGSSLAFGMAHVMWGPAAMFWTFILGMILGGLRVWRGNVWSAVAAHAVLDLMIEPGLFQNAFRLQT